MGFKEECSIVVKTSVIRLIENQLVGVKETLMITRACLLVSPWFVRGSLVGVTRSFGMAWFGPGFLVLVKVEQDQLLPSLWRRPGHSGRNAGKIVRPFLAVTEKPFTIHATASWEAPASLQSWLYHFYLQSWTFIGLQVWRFLYTDTPRPTNGKKIKPPTHLEKGRWAPFGITNILLPPAR